MNSGWDNNTLNLSGLELILCIQHILYIESRTVHQRILIQIKTLIVKRITAVL